jgi:hypothetical protein
MEEERDPTTAASEASAARTDIEQQLQGLAKAYPKVMGIGCIWGGEVHGVMALTSHTRGAACSPAGVNQMRIWAKIIAGLPPEMRSAFEDALANIPRS